MKVRLVITNSNCRCGYHSEGDSFIIEDICPPICHELWQCIYPNVYTLLNGGKLDYGDIKAAKFEALCPDNGRVMITGERID